MTRPAAFVWDDGRTLEGLGDAIADVPILNRPLAAHQADALGPPAPRRIASLADIPAEARGYVLVRGHVWLTRRLVARFVTAARAAGAPTAVLALEPCTFARSTTALMDVRRDGERTIYDVWYRQAPGPPTEDELAQARPVPVAIREHAIPNDMLERRGVRPEGMDVALTTEAVLHVCHWSHVVVANYVALFARWFALTPRKVLGYLWALLRALPWPSRWRVMRKLTVRGRRCKIHPSAVVEASILGDDVDIGPCAVVRGCVLGNGVKIDAHANVNQSSLGDGAVVSFNTQCNLMVLYPRAMISIIGTQMGVLGRGATALGGSLLMDLRDPYLEREVSVVHHGARVPSGRKILGPCLGHDTIVAAGVKLAPGMMVPNGAYLVGDPEDVIRRIDAAPPAREPHSVQASGGIGPPRRHG